jgi:putative phosphoesterase
MTLARVAALYDIHGNLPALDAVLAELDEVRPDLVVIGGDIVSGPMPRETFDRLMELGERAVFIRGNGDRAVAHGDVPPHADDVWVARERWIAEQLTDAQRAFLGDLAETAVVEVEGLRETLFCHGSPRSDEEIVTRVTPDARLREILAGVEQPVVVLGHTHVQFDRAVAGKRVVNAGSVGMPYEDESGAYWALLGPDVELRRTPYDLEAAAERIRRTGFPGSDEFIRETLLSHPGAAEVSEYFEGLAAESAR